MGPVLAEDRIGSRLDDDSNPSAVKAIGPGIWQIDAMLAHQSGLTAAYLVGESGPILVDPGAQTSAEWIAGQLAKLGVGPSDLAGIAVTHVHLDHAGGAGDLLRLFPGAELYCHPAGAPHLIDPSRLVASAARVFAERLDTVYGRMTPAPRERVRPLGDREILGGPSGRLHSVYSPGHARHHLGFLDAESGILLAGDSIGVKLEGTVSKLRPATPPPDFDLELAVASLASYRTLGPAGLALAHFGVVVMPELDSESAARRYLDAAEQALVTWAAAARRWQGDFPSAGPESLADALRNQFCPADVPLTEVARLELLNGFSSNAAGLFRWLGRAASP